MYMSRAKRSTKHAHYPTSGKCARDPHVTIPTLPYVLVVFTHAVWHELRYLKRAVMWRSYAQSQACSPLMRRLTHATASTEFDDDVHHYQLGQTAAGITGTKEVCIRNLTWRSSIEMLSHQAGFSQFCRKRPSKGNMIRAPPGRLWWVVSPWGFTKDSYIAYVYYTYMVSLVFVLPFGTMGKYV